MNYEYTDLNVKSEIRNHYRGDYERAAERQRPWLAGLRNVMFAGGMITAGAGVLGLVAAGVMAYFSVPFVAPVLISSIAAVPAGVASFFKSFGVGDRINRLRDQLLEQDIINYKLIKSYVKDVLPEKTKSLQGERLNKQEAYKKDVAELDRRETILGQQRKLALDMVRQGLGTLEQQLDISRKELDFFKQEAAQAFGDDFDAAAQKPQLAVVVPQPAAVRHIARASA